ncbi:hypothetical protein UFOVP1221_12 [uncultured Caudovirales phage]|uniref:Uncharacterized protein n=1 Tax=uncultured Caudovirales phage TaxID=2100421 RepID=A0A6J5MG66_9CAUD|nr:hypothetical protein UFOVP491_4 [uncultured Caudovirales phage]CAB4191181.1 hypothetical protein UFOVP1221_12 [uncultured Caudovirales phage]
MTKTIEINAETGEEILRDLTTVEQSAYDEMVASLKSKNADEEIKETAKAELLARLGITAEEAKLLLS